MVLHQTPTYFQREVLLGLSPLPAAPAAQPLLQVQETILAELVVHLGGLLAPAVPRQE